MNCLRNIAPLLLAIVLAGCSIGDVVKESETADRVLVVYLGGDNNLSGEASAKIDAISRGWSGKQCDKIVIYADIDGQTPQLMEVVDGGITRVVAVYASENSASAEVFGRVLCQVRESYPALNYGLLVFSHASGWLPEGRLAEPVQVGDEERIEALSLSYGGSRSIIMDGEREMELADFASAIPAGMFDYIVLEACFMAGIEVAWELRSKCDYILASSAEIVAPGFTPTYVSNMRILLSGDSEAFGRAVFGEVLTYAENDYRRSAVYSLVRTAGLEPLADFVANNCDFTKTAEITSMQRFDRELGTGAVLFFDFADYFSRLLPTEWQRSELQRLTGECIAWKASTATFMLSYGGFAVNLHSGLTTYVKQPSLPYLNSRYAELGWAKRINLP